MKFKKRKNNQRRFKLHKKLNKNQVTVMKKEKKLNIKEILKKKFQQSYYNLNLNKMSS